MPNRLTIAVISLLLVACAAGAYYQWPVNDRFLQLTVGKKPDGTPAYWRVRASDVVGYGENGLPNYGYPVTIEQRGMRTTGVMESLADIQKLLDIDVVTMKDGEVVKVFEGSQSSRGAEPQDR